MRRIIFLITVFIGVCGAAFAQDYSRRGLMEVKEQSEAGRLDWNRAFDEAAQTKNFAGLAAPRQALEKYMNFHLNNIRKLQAQGDARALLTAVDNYLQIQKQYVKNVMIPAENLNGSDAEAIDKVNQQTVEFAQKEKIFLMEINNALATSGQDDMPPAQVDPEMNEEEPEEEEPKAAMPGERPKAKKKTKLPHEIMDEEEEEPTKSKTKNKGKKTKGRSRDNDDEGYD